MDSAQNFKQVGATTEHIGETSVQRFKLIVGVHLLLVRDGKILLARRCNTGFGDGQYSAVAGHLDGNEELKSATAREAYEELGIHIDPAELSFAGVIHRLADDERLNFFFAAHNWVGEVTNAEPGKCDDLRWFAPDDLPANLVPYVRRAIENYTRQTPYDSLGWT